MSTHTQSTSREERKAQLIYKWNCGKQGLMAVLSMYHKISPTGEALLPGMSVIDVIVEDEFGPEPASLPSPNGNSSQATDASHTGWTKV
jgi:hypothetical protein